MSLMLFLVSLCLVVASLVETVFGGRSYLYLTHRGHQPETVAFPSGGSYITSQTDVYFPKTIENTGIETVVAFQLTDKLIVTGEVTRILAQAYDDFFWYGFVNEGKSQFGSKQQSPRSNNKFFFRLFIYSSIHLFIYSSIHLFIYSSFIY